MKKWVILLFFSGTLSCQTFNTDIIPASTGLKLGHSNQRWDAYLRNVNISGTCTIQGIPCGQGGGGGGGGMGDPGSNGIMKRISLNVSAIAGASDINAALGYTAANDSLAAHLAGTEIFTGSKTFNLSAILSGITNRTGNYFPLTSASNASPAGTLVMDAPNGYLVIQADAGGGSGTGGQLALYSANGPFGGPFASLLVSSSGVQVDSTGTKLFAGGGLKTILTGPGTVQFGDTGGTKGAISFVGNTSGTQTIGCPDATCSAFNVPNVSVGANAASIDNSGNASATSVATTGTTAGFYGIGQGTAQSIIANTIGLTGGTSITGYNLIFPSAAANGIPRWANSSNIVTQSVSELSGDCTTSGSNAVTCLPLVSLTTSTPVSVSSTASSGFYNNQHATAATAVTYNLPTAAAGKQFCFTNSYNGSAADTGVLTIATSASGQFIIFTDGTLSATGGNITSGGAAADAACVVGVDSTHWQLYVQRGTWTKH